MNKYLAVTLFSSSGGRTNALYSEMQISLVWAQRIRRRCAVHFQSGALWTAQASQGLSPQDCEAVPAKVRGRKVLRNQKHIITRSLKLLLP